MATYTPAQIDHIVSRFLAWKLPANFNPDGGITATRPNYAPEVKWEPCGTNLLDYQQAKDMVLHILEDLPVAYDQNQIETAKAIYKTLLHLERHLAASPEPDPEALRLAKRLHKLLNRIRRLIAPELTFEQFLAVIGETPVNSLDTDPPADPESGGGPKDDDDDDNTGQ